VLRSMQQFYFRLALLLVALLILLSGHVYEAALSTEEGVNGGIHF
jgi:hypothetical protein